MDTTGVAQTCIPVSIVLVGICREVGLLAVPLAGPAGEARLSRLWLPPAIKNRHHLSQLPEAGVRLCMAPCPAVPACTASHTHIATHKSAIV